MPRVSVLVAVTLAALAALGPPGPAAAGLFGKWAPFGLGAGPEKVVRDEPAGDGPGLVEPLDLAGWITQLWEPVGVASGLLDDDDLTEVVVVLHRRDAIPGDRGMPVGSRAIAIFSLSPAGRWRRTALAEGILPCVECLGTFNRDPGGFPFEIDIDERRLTLAWIGNLDGLAAVRLTVLWDRERHAYRLAEDDVVRVDPLTEERTRRRRDFVAGREWIDGEERPLAPRFVPIEDVAAEDYR